MSTSIYIMQWLHTELREHGWKRIKGYALGARSVATKERVPAKQNRAKRARRGPTASRRNAQTP